MYRVIVLMAFVWGSARRVIPSWSVNDFLFSRLLSDIVKKSTIIIVHVSSYFVHIFVQLYKIKLVLSSVYSMHVHT